MPHAALEADAELDPWDVPARVTQEDQVEAQERFIKLWESIGSLNNKQFRVIIRRYGLDGHGDATLQEIADELGVVKERVRQIEAEALDKLCINLSGLPTGGGRQHLRTVAVKLRGKHHSRNYPIR